MFDTVLFIILKASEWPAGVHVRVFRAEPDKSVTGWVQAFHASVRANSQWMRTRAEARYASQPPRWGTAPRRCSAAGSLVDVVQGEAGQADEHQQQVHDDDRAGSATVTAVWTAQDRMDIL